MFWNSVSEFVAMGGYGDYVWGAYGVTLMAIVIEVLALRLRSRRLGTPAQRALGAGQS